MGEGATLSLIGGIIRVSTDSAEQAQSPENQRAHLIQAGCEIFYEDKVSGSAKRGEKRRQSAVWQQLETDIKTRKLTKLMVCEVNRIARRDHLIMHLVELCDEFAIEFLATSGGELTTKTAPQWLSVKQQAVFSEFFAREQADKIKRGQAAAIQRGVFGFSSSHLAWHLVKDPDDPRKVVRHPDRWDTAKEMITAYIEGRLGTTEMARTIYERHGVLRQPAGVNKWFKSHWLRGHYGRRGGEVLIANIAPAIVTEEEWSLLQTRIKANAKEKGTRAAHKKRALTGVCECALCGMGMTYAVRGKYRYLRCNKPDCDGYLKNVPEHVVEEQLREFIIAGDYEDFELHSKRLTATAKPTKELLNLKLRAKKLEEALVIVESPGVRSDYVEATQRIAELEQAMQPSEPERLTREDWDKIVSGEWWKDRDDHQRNTDYLFLFKTVTVNGPGKAVQYVQTRYCPGCGAGP